jgi:hypothetical protein
MARNLSESLDELADAVANFKREFRKTWPSRMVYATVDLLARWLDRTRR